MFALVTRRYEENSDCGSGGRRFNSGWTPQFPRRETDGIRAAIATLVNDTKGIAAETKAKLINQQLPTFISCLEGKFAA